MTEQIEFTQQIIDSNGSLRITIPKYLVDLLKINTKDIVKVNINKIKT